MYDASVLSMLPYLSIYLHICELNVCLNRITLPSSTVERMVAPLLDRKLPIGASENAPARMPVFRIDIPALSPVQYLAVVSTGVLIIDARAQSFHDVAPGEVYDAHIGAAEQCLSNLV